MKSKTIIILFIFILVVAVAGGAYLVSNKYIGVGAKSRSVSKEPSSSKIDLSKIPEPEIIAEYKYESRINDAVFFDEGTPKVVATEKELIFYNRSGKIVRRRPLKLYEQVRISENGEYIAFVQGSGLMGTRDKMTYENIRGKILFERWLEAQWPNPAPLGDYLVLTPIGYHDLIEFVNRDGKTIAKYHMGVGGGMEGLKFSKDGKRCFSFAGAMVKPITHIKCFEDMGGRLAFEKELNIHMDSFDISEDGHYWVIGGIVKEKEWKDQEGQLQTEYTPGFSFYRDNNLIFSKDGTGSIVSISKNGEIITGSELTYYHEIQPEELIAIFTSKGNIINHVKVKALNLFETKDEVFIEYLKVVGINKIVGVISARKKAREITSKSPNPYDYIGDYLIIIDPMKQAYSLYDFSSMAWTSSAKIIFLGDRMILIPSLGGAGEIILIMI